MLQEIIINKKNYTKNLNSLFEERNFLYFFSIKKILFIPNVKKKIKNKDITNLILNLITYFKYLNQLKTIKPARLSIVGIDIISKNSFLVDLFLEENCNVKKIITDKKIIEEVDFELIDKIVMSNMEINTEKVSDKKLSFKSEEDLKLYLIELIDRYNYPFSEYITKFFLELDYETAFKTRRSHIQLDPVFSDKRFTIILNSMNSYFNEIYNIFQRKGEFIYDLFKSSYLYNQNKIADYLVSLLRRDTFNLNHHKYNTYALASRWTLLRDFSIGLVRLNDFYALDFQDFNVYARGKFADLDVEKQFNIINSLANELSDETIFTIFKIRDLTFNNIKQDKKLVNEIDSLLENDNKSSKLRLRKQVLSSINKSIIDEFFFNKSKYINKFKDFKITELEKIEPKQYSKFDLITFCLNYHKKNYKIRIAQNNQELFYYIYYNSKIRIKDKIFRIEDLDRIFLSIMNFPIYEGDGFFD